MEGRKEGAAHLETRGVRADEVLDLLAVLEEDERRHLCTRQEEGKIAARVSVAGSSRKRGEETRTARTPTSWAISSAASTSTL